MCSVRGCTSRAEMNVARRFPNAYCGKHDPTKVRIKTPNGFWKSKRGMNEFLEALSESDCDICLPLQDLDDLFENWWKTHVHGIESTVPLVCQKCKHRSEPKIHNFVKNKTGRCGCFHRTEALVRSFLIDRGQQGQSFRSPWSDKHRTYDFGICCATGTLQGLIEIDGLQHFKFIPSWHTDLQKQLRRDFDMEVECFGKVPLLRLSQESIHNQLFDWKRVVARFVELCLLQTVPPRVFREQGCTLYEQGPYQQMREGSCVCVDGAWFE